MRIKIIYLMWQRQLIRYWRSRARMIGALGQPVLFFLALGFGFGPVYARAGGGNYLEFLAPGVMAMTILFTSMFAGMEVIWDRQFGFLKETMVAPVSRWEIMLGKTLGGATIALIQALIVFVITLFFGFQPNWALLPVALIFMFVLALTFTALGVSIASQLEDMQAFPIIMNFLIMPIFFLSGALFPLDNLPRAIDFVVNIDPLSYGVDGIRGALIGGSHYGLWVDFAVLAVVAFIFISIGTYLFSRIEA
ncbi:MAG: ABC transporter permease [Candidatus Staskawiczbacteria bacterium]|nr:ABC transporter permease [Candidatus Staskawiczbacteria bacterium]